jgi:hypothetical protein
MNNPSQETRRDRSGGAEAPPQTAEAQTMSDELRQGVKDLFNRTLDSYCKLSAKCADAMWEARQALESAGLNIDAMRMRERQEEMGETFERALHFLTAGMVELEIELEEPDDSEE